MNRRFVLRLLPALGAALAASRRPALAAATDVSVPADAMAAFAAREMVDLQGATRRLADWRGRPMVVNFWATWCVPCVKEMPELDALQKEHPKVQFIGIGVDSADNMRKFLAKVPVSYPLLVMGPGAIDTLRSLGNPAGGLPFTLVFNADGSINRKILGQIKSDDLARTLATLSG